MNITGRIDTHLEIARHPANDSTAKQQFSFSKAPRFTPPKTYTSTITYELPSTKGRRHAGIGYGTRSRFFDGQNTSNPAPTNYHMQSSFEQPKEPRGFSFGHSRDKIKYANYLKQGEQTPAGYGLNESQVKTSRAYSLRPKTAYPKNYFLPCKEDSLRIGQLPGPGNYETIDVMGTGKDFYNSKFKTQKQKSFNGSDRFSKGKRTPGPGDYSVQQSIEPDGICFLSTMKSHGRRQILNEKRQLKLAGNRDTPGPGEYQKPSDFGHYDKPGAISRPQTARI